MKVTIQRERLLKGENNSCSGVGAYVRWGSLRPSLGKTFLNWKFTKKRSSYVKSSGKPTTGTGHMRGKVLRLPWTCFALRPAEAMASRELLEIWPLADHTGPCRTGKEACHLFYVWKPLESIGKGRHHYLHCTLNRPFRFLDGFLVEGNLGVSETT